MSGLARFRADAVPEPEVARRSLAEGVILSFDQSLTATGWALLESMPTHLYLRATGSIMTKPKDFPTGPEGTLQRGVFVARHLRIVYEEMLTLKPNLVVIHETPPVGSAMVRPESSLLAALGVRMALPRDITPAMVQNQHSKKVLTGKRDATKNEWHAALENYPITGLRQASNEGQRDAVCLALTHFIDKVGES